MFWRKRTSRDDDLDREIRGHLELEAEEQRERGLSPEDARYAAKRALGNATQIKESVRATWGWSCCEHAAQDIRYSFRLLLKTPVLTGVAILSLALGIGANTAIFSVTNALMLRSLPVRNPQQIVRIGAVNPDSPNPNETISLTMFRELRKRATVFSDVFAWLGGGLGNIEANGVRFAGRADAVSADYFGALGVHPVLGRLLNHEDAPLDGRPSAQVAVISYRCWQHRYGGDPHVLGKTIRVDNVPLTIVGVSPPDFTSLEIEIEPDAIVPIGFTHDQLKIPAGLRWFVFGRLRPNIDISQARAQLQVLWPKILKATVPISFHGVQRSRFFALQPDIQPFARGFAFLRHKLNKPLEILMALVGAVLLIACLNLANLLLARASSRRHELAVRAAMGAGRWPLMRMLLTEAMLLSCTGAAIGLWMAPWTARYLLRNFWTGFSPLALDPSLDVRVLLFTAALAIFTGALFGIVPAWQMSRADPANSLSQSARTTGGRTGHFSRALIAVQVSLSLVLLIGAALFVRSLQNLQNVNLGYRRDHLLILDLFQQPGRQNPANPAVYYHELATRLSQLPGVQSASYLDVGLATGREFREAVSARDTGAVANAVKEAAGPRLFPHDWNAGARGPRI